MKTKLIVIAGILSLPLSVAFADVNNSNTIPNNTDGTTTTQPIDKNNQPSTGTDRHDKSNIHRSNDMHKRGTHNVTDDVPVKQTPNDVPVKQTPNDVPVKQPSDLSPSHPSTTN